MGAQFNDVVLKGTKDEVRKQFEALQEEDRHENGHSYSGGFGQARGLTFVDDRSFSDNFVARDWVIDNQQKWDPAIAVHVGSINGDTWLIGAWCAC